MPVLSKFVDKGLYRFINKLYYKPIFSKLSKMGLIVQIINKSTILPKAQELQICSKQASIHELSTPTNKLATYFGDDKPTSRSVFNDNPY